MYKRWSKLSRIIVIVFLIPIVFYGCSFRFGYTSQSSKSEIKGSYSSLTDKKETSIELKEGDTITLSYDITLKSGTFSAVFVDSSENVLFTFEPNTDGTMEITVDKDDTYNIKIEAEDAKGSYEFQWEFE